MKNSPHITLTQPPPLGQPPHHTMATTIVNTSTHTTTGSNRACFEPQVMYFFFSFSFFSFTNDFLHLELVRWWQMAPTSHTLPPPLRIATMSHQATTINTSAHTTTRSNGAHFKPYWQVMYIFFFSFFLFTNDFLHLDYMYYHHRHASVHPHCDKTI